MKKIGGGLEQTFLGRGHRRLTPERMRGVCDHEDNPKQNHHLAPHNHQIRETSRTQQVLAGPGGPGLVAVATGPQWQETAWRFLTE